MIINNSIIKKGDIPWKKLLVAITAAGLKLGY